jgi:hypothetical protein
MNTRIPGINNLTRDNEMSSPISPPKSSSTKTEVVFPIPNPHTHLPTNTTTTIDTPLQDVLDVSLDFENWPKWNRFVPLATVISQSSPSRLEVGGVLTFHSRMQRDGPTSGSYSNHEIVTIEEIERQGKQGWGIGWKTVGISGGEWVLRAERVQEFKKWSLKMEGKGWSTKLGVLLETRWFIC